MSDATAHTVGERIYRAASLSSLTENRFEAIGAATIAYAADKTQALETKIQQLDEQIAILTAERFQSRVNPWLHECFTPEICSDKIERADRLAEEFFEALQAVDYPQERLAALQAYSYGRPKGDLPQEIGGVMVTLAAFCLAYGLDMHDCGEVELARVWTKVEQIRAKQKAKPTGSALPM
jgi:NTP pyrophosphatase (non-canonical NTP hydrolase)